MAISASLTSKGQMTLPKEVREHFGLKAGDRLDIAIDREQIVLVPRTLHVDDICSSLPSPGRVVSIEEMERVIRDGAAE